MTSTRLEHAFDLFDQANSADPNFEIVDQKKFPKELLYAQRMSNRLEAFSPHASDHLKLAARAQHIERWKSPRSNYPEGRAGYKKWRAELNLFHAERAGELMSQAGYGEDDISRVKFLIQKRQMSRDPETQALEDIICLVFLEHYLEPFAAKHSEEKLIDIIKKTWNKMSTTGHSAALDIRLPEHLQTLISKAIA